MLTLRFRSWRAEAMDGKVWSQLLPQISRRPQRAVFYSFIFKAGVCWFCG